MTDLLTDTELAEIERLTKLHIGDRPPWGNTILRLVGEVMRLRAAEQPPTPPSGRVEDRERIAEIRREYVDCAFYLIDPPRSGEPSMKLMLSALRDTMSAVDSRDAVIAALVKALEANVVCGCTPHEDGGIAVCWSCQMIDTARPFTKETR